MHNQYHAFQFEKVTTQLGSKFNPQSTVFVAKCTRSDLIPTKTSHSLNSLLKLILDVYLHISMQHKV